MHGIAESVQGGSRLHATAGPVPLVSMVIVVFNDCEELSALIANLAPFRGPEAELIIVDGGSNDGSLEVLRQKDGEIDFWLSEPDKGIYHAMNKGLSAARGEYVLHINAGDRLLELPLDKLRALGERKVDVVCCRVLEDDTHLFIPRNDWLMRFDNTWHHQGTFYRRQAHLRYDPAYRVFGDFEHNQRMHKAGSSVEILDAIVAAHRTNGASRYGDQIREVYRSIRRHSGLMYVPATYARYKLLKLRALLASLRSKKS